MGRKTSDLRESSKVAGLSQGTFFDIQKKRSLFRLGTILIIALIGLVLLLVVPKSTPVLVSDSVSEANPNTYVFVHSYTSTEYLDYMAANFDIVDNHPYNYELSLAEIAYLHQKNPNLKIVRYRSSVEAFDVVSTGFNDSASWSESFAERQNTEAEWNDIWQNHQDWFLRNSAGNYIHRKSTETVEMNPKRAYVMDPGNAGWRNWLANKAQQYVDYGFDGLFLDLVTASYWGGWDSYPMNPETGLLYTNSQWREKLVSLVDVVKLKIGNKTLIFNGLNTGKEYYNNNNPAPLDEANADGMMIEGFLRWSSDAVGQPRSETDWKKDVDLLVKTGSLGKVVCVNSAIDGVEPAPSDEEIEELVRYLFASFLVGRTGNSTYFRFNSPGYPPNSIVPTYWEKDLPMYHIQIGDAIGPYYKQNNVYQRDFTNGKVLVNPTDSGSTYIVQLGNFFQTLEGQTVTSVNLAPKTGTILTKIAGGGAPTVSFNSPIDGATVSGKVALSDNASDDLSVTKVEFYIDGELDTTDTAVPYEATWYTNYYMNGSHTIMAKAYDASGNTGTATITVNVSSQITSPLTGTSVLVKYKAGTTQAVMDAVVQRLNLIVQKAFVMSHRVSVPGSMSVAHFISILLNQPEVEYAEPDYKRSTSLEGDEIIPVEEELLSKSDGGIPGLETASALEGTFMSGTTTGTENSALQSLSSPSVANRDTRKAVSQDINYITTSSLYTVLSLFVVAAASFLRRILFL